MILDIPAVPMMVTADKQNIDMIISYFYSLLAYLSSITVVTPQELSTTLSPYVTDDELTASLLPYATDAELTAAIAAVPTYSDEQAQDALGTILTDTGTVDLLYNDGLNVVTASVIPGTVTAANSTLWNNQSYDASSFTMTATGFAVVTTTLVTYVRVGKQVTLVFGSITETSNATTFTLTGLPSTLLPAVTADFTVNLLTNTGYIFGLMRLTASASAITLYPGTGGTWTASGLKGMGYPTVTYICV